jgi:hypothetical protein
LYFLPLSDTAFTQREKRKNKQWKRTTEPKRENGLFDQKGKRIGTSQTKDKSNLKK